MKETFLKMRLKLKIKINRNQRKINWLNKQRNKKSHSKMFTLKYLHQKSNKLNIKKKVKKLLKNYQKDLKIFSRKRKANNSLKLLKNI